MTDTQTDQRLTTEELADTQPGSTAVADTETAAPPMTTTDRTPADAQRPATAANAGQAAAPPDPQQSALLGNSSQFLDRWTAIQTTFVDQPREAVEQADTLVAEVIRELARVFAEERGRLEAAWSQGSEVSTEDLRQALQRYRDFFHLLLRS